MTLPKQAYNPSILRHAGRWLMVSRDHDRGDWRCSLYLSVLTSAMAIQSTVKIQPPLTLAENSHEDPRLFIHQGVPWLAWTVARAEAKQFRCAICFGQLVEDGEQWSVGNYYFPAHGRNDFSALEKNWVPFECAGALWTYYATNGDAQSFLRMENGRVAEVVKSKSLPWPNGPIHGGAICRSPNGNWMHFFNSHTIGRDRILHRYAVGVAELSAQPPFGMLRISRRPILIGEEGVNLNGYKWYKPNVVFACGATFQDGMYNVSYGWNDAKCRVVKLGEGELLL